MSGGPRDLVATLRARGLLHQVTDEALGRISAGEVVTLYNGFDPSATSLHAGSLYPVMIMAHAARCGHRPVALVGGGTGLIGDPSGKTEERPLLDAEAVRANVEGMGAQMRRLLEAAGTRPEIVNNADWLEGVRLVEFLRDVGKHFTVNWMMAKDSVRARLEDRDQGISYTEFTYMLLQAYDFYRLHEDRGVRLQTGASDQWGNITAGIELIRRKAGKQAFGLTCPLLLTPDGRKFGKSVEGAVWLDPARTSPYRFYQFWINQEDAVASTLLAAYTFLPMETVVGLREEAGRSPQNRIVQERLAREVTTFVHGPTECDRAIKTSKALFSGQWDRLELADLEGVFSSAPSITVPADAVSAGQLKAGDAFTRPELGLCASKSAYRNHVSQGSLSINGKPLDPGILKSGDLVLQPGDFLKGRMLILRRGKKHYGVVRLSQA